METLQKTIEFEQKCLEIMAALDKDILHSNFLEYVTRNIINTPTKRYAKIREISRVLILVA